MAINCLVSTSYGVLGSGTKGKMALEVLFLGNTLLNREIVVTHAVEQVIATMLCAVN
jgi:hypothetical protein